MKVLVLYRPNSEYASMVEGFVRGLQEWHNIDAEQVESVDYDSREGAAMADVYGVTDQPALVVVDGDGGYIKSWQGTELPLTEEVAGYLYTYS